jgi:hypothetical protein
VYSKCLRRPIWEDTKATSSVITSANRGKSKLETVDAKNGNIEPDVAGNGLANTSSGTATQPTPVSTPCLPAAPPSSANDEETTRIGSSNSVDEHGAGKEGGL